MKIQIRTAEEEVFLIIDNDNEKYKIDITEEVMLNNIGNIIKQIEDLLMSLENLKFFQEHPNYWEE
jgi:hypothetical protein